MPLPYPTLLAITAHARSGALDHAWRLFREGGYDTVDDDPEILNVRGRLLKDRALEASGHEQRRFYLLAADAYARAAELSPATYPLINAATLSLLAGRAEPARARAQQLLDHMAQGEDEPDTPYWREATRAEALLVLGRVDEAKAALTAATLKAPAAWEDHASTLRQFGLILRELGETSDWLDRFRPPRTLHFAGHMGLAEGGGDALRRKIRAVLEKENIGFGFGALAAGADIVIAEALLDHGAELHLVLPAPADLFREASVDRYGPDWGARFDRLLHGAESLSAMDASAGATHPLAIRLAAEVAVGGAVIKAHTLMTEAVQLLILDRPEPAALDAEVSASAWIAAHWAQSGRRRHILVAPRETAAATPDAEEAETPAQLAAMLAVDFSVGPDPADRRLDRLIERVFPRLCETLAAAPQPACPPRWSGETLFLVYDRPLDAAAAALSIASALAGVGRYRIGGHYGLVRRAQDPLSSGALLLGPAVGVPHRMLDSAPIGAVHVTEAFAAALHAAPVRQRPRTEYVGDLPMGDEEDDMRLFSLKR